MDDAKDRCPVVVRWLDDNPDTPCTRERGHEGRHVYITRSEEGADPRMIPPRD